MGCSFRGGTGPGSWPWMVFAEVVAVRRRGALIGPHPAVRLGGGRGRFAKLDHTLCSTAPFPLLLVVLVSPQPLLCEWETLETWNGGGSLGC